MSISPDERLIFALDVPTYELGIKLVNKLDNLIKVYKVGLELFMTGDYFSFITQLITQYNKKVFCDLKILDIPITVERTIKQLEKYQISFVTIHAQSKKIIEAAANVKNNIKILGVTLLTSIDQEDLKISGIDLPLIEVVKWRAKAAIDAGCDGLVCAGTDVEEVRKIIGDDPILVCPGIRLTGKLKHDDQKRICTPRQAIKNGADYIVVGRSIRDAKNPKDVALSIQKEISNAL